MSKESKAAVSRQKPKTRLGNQAGPKASASSDRSAMTANSTSKALSRIGCRRCKGQGWFEFTRPCEIYDGELRTFVAECRCLKARRMSEQLDLIPPRFRSPKLSRLLPQPSRHESQADVIAQLRCEPDASYLLLGLNGVGKTHFGWALYRHAVVSGRRAVACKVSELIEDYRRATLSEGDRDAYEPRLMVEDLIRTRSKATLFLDELDKAKPTEFASRVVFDIIDAAYQYEHQVIITSNYTLDELTAHWGKEGLYWGTSIMRRLQDACMVINLF